MTMHFRTTRWSIVTATADHDDHTARRALDELCKLYWYPLYAWLRREGHADTAAMDLVQGFLTSLLERGRIDGVETDRGRFRSYLLGALRHYLANTAREARAQKRGGDLAHLSLDVEAAEGRFVAEAVDGETPERAFDRSFALTLLDTVLATLEAEYAARGRSAAFAELRRYLVERPGPAEYAQVAATLGTSVSAVKVTVHRMRQRLKELLLAEIAETVEPGAADDELAALFRALER